MRRCPRCDDTFPDEIAVCPTDGASLGKRRAGRELDATVPFVVAPPAADAPNAAAATGEIAVGAARTVAAQPASSASGDRLAPGTTVGEYEIRREIGAGGMAAVYAAVHPVIGKDVAIKVLGAAFASDPSVVARFVQEARAVNQIRHSNIVDIFAIGQLPDGRHYCVMELLAGEPLDRRLRRQPPPTYEEMFAILLQVADALEAAHRASIVHRDLKPENVFLVPAEGGSMVKLLDFGIAKLMDADGPGRRRTHAGVLLGTPEYMAPEQGLSKEVDARTDVYSLGVIMYEMFTGRLPFQGESYMEVINRHLSQPVPPPSELAPLPAALEELILACLAKEASARPSSAAEVRDRLLGMAQDQSLDMRRIAPRTGGLAATAARLSADRLSAERRMSGEQGAATPSGSTSEHRPAAAARSGITAGRLLAGVLLLAASGLAIVGLLVVVSYLRDTTKAPALAPAPMVALQVISDPPGATVIIDGERQKLVTPYVYNVLHASELTLRVELDGHRAHEQVVRLAAGESEKIVQVDLESARPIELVAPTAPGLESGLEPEPEPAAEEPAVVRPAARPQPSGAAPVIADLEYEPATARAGGSTTVTGRISFEDPEGDAAEVASRIRPAGGRPRVNPRSRLALSGARKGTAAFTFVIRPGAPGSLPFEVWLIDATGNVSNTLSGEIAIEEGESGTPAEAPDAAPAAE